VTIVLDASAIGEYLLRTDRAPAVERLVSARGVGLHVPALCDVEIAAVLRRALRRRLLTEARAHLVATHYTRLPLTRHGHTLLLARIPPEDRPSHLAWYTIILNIAILAGSLGGSGIADHIGLVTALIVFGISRILAGLYILKWG
jgi:hypothetical protein